MGVSMIFLISWRFSYNAKTPFRIKKMSFYMKSVKYWKAYGGGEMHPNYYSAICHNQVNDCEGCSK